MNWIQLAILLLASNAVAEVPMLVFPKQVKIINGVGVKSDDPTHLDVGTPIIRLEGTKVVGVLVVENKSATALNIVVNPYGGELPYGGTSPFTLGFGPSSLVTYQSQLLPPAPPKPIVITFPAHAKISFSTTLDLSPWGWQGTPEVSFIWTFHFATVPAVTGTQVLRLPKK